MKKSLVRQLKDNITAVIRQKQKWRISALQRYRLTQSLSGTSKTVNNQHFDTSIMNEYKDINTLDEKDQVINHH